jgi:hypothetical protein
VKGHFVEAYGHRFRRSTCGRCGEPVEWLGEALRINRAEGGFTMLPVCLPCVRRSRLSVVPGGSVSHETEVMAA